MGGFFLGRGMPILIEFYVGDGNRQGHYFNGEPVSKSIGDQLDHIGEKIRLGNQ